MTDPSHHCRECGSTCRVVPIHHGDGRVEVEGYYCQNKVCELHGRNQLHYGTWGFHETAFGADGAARHTSFGPPSRGADNEVPTCRAFVSVLRRDFGLAIGDVEAVDVQDDHKVDARASWPSGGWLNMQVTRALPRDDYEVQASAEEIERVRGASDIVELMRRAIEAKHDRARSDITLLIDGRSAADLALMAAPIRFESTYGEWARDEGWESVWVVGPTSATPLDRRVTEAPPSTWPARGS